MQAGYQINLQEKVAAMLRPINTAEAVALAGDLAGLTDPSDTETARLCRLAVHYRERIAELEAAVLGAVYLLRDEHHDAAVELLEQVYHRVGKL